MHLQKITFLLLYITFYSLASEPVFLWTTKTDTADIFATSGTARYYAKSGVSDGTLRTEDEWAAAMFDNSTLEDEWCPTSEGSIELYWQYTAPWSGKMLFQITGKDRTLKEDTNDGWSLIMRGNNVGEFDCNMGLEIPDNPYKVVTARNRYKPITLVDGQWYHFRLKYHIEKGISMQIDNGEIFTSNEPLDKTRCTAWHQLLIGNDTEAKGVQRIDNFCIWSTWLDSFPESKISIDVNFKESYKKKNIAIINQSSKGFYSLDGRFIGQGVKPKATILQVETFQNIPARKVLVP